MKVAYKRKIPEKLGQNLKAVVAISIPYEESMFNDSNQNGEPFLETMNLISENERISEVTVLITDKLQIHNLKVIYSLNQEEAEIRAEELGKLWYKVNIENNASFFANFRKKLTIKFWDDYKKCNEYFEIQKEIKNLYNTEKPNGFYQKTRSLAGVFTNKTLERLENKQNGIYSKDEFINSSIELLLEESTVRVILGSHFDLEFYPDELDIVMGTACEKYSNSKPYRVALTIKKSQKNQDVEVRIKNSNKMDNFFFEKSYSYQSTLSSTSMNSIIEPQNPHFSPFFGAILSSTMLAVKNNDDPLFQTKFLFKYNQFLNEFIAENQEDNKHSFINNKTSIILDNDVSKEEDKNDNKYRENKL